MDFSQKPDPALVESLHDIVATIPDATLRKMFGCDGFMIGDYFAGGVWRDGCIFKLPDDDAALFMEQPGTTPFMPGGGSMKMTGWYVLPHDLARDLEVMRRWAERAAVFAASLPPKAAKKTAAKKKSKP